MDSFQRDATFSKFLPITQSRMNLSHCYVTTMHYDKGTESLRANKHIKFSV